MYQQITIQTLQKQGIKKTQIARELGCHRNTVQNVLGRETAREKQTRDKSSAFDTYKPQIKDYLTQKLTKLRIYEKLGETYPIESAYDTLCKYIQKHFPTPVEAFGVQLVSPGEVGEIDFGYLGMLPGVDGKHMKTYGLAVILGYSRIGFFAITYDQKLETLIKELTNAFTYFGGVPKNLKVDNMRTAILKNQHYDLQFNEDFLGFANHYNTVITPCTPYHPEQKGKVESGIKYVQNNFIAGRTFTDDRDIKRQVTEWMDTYANQRVHGTTKKVPAEEFANAEKQHLLALPADPFAFFNRGIRTVAPHCHIHFQNNYYSVPSNLVGKEVTIRWNESIIRIIALGEQVALHKLAVGQGNYVTERSHMPEYKTYSQTEYQARYEEKMVAIGESAHEYFRMLLRVKSAYWFQKVRIILGLTEQYGSEAVNLTLRRCLYYNVTDMLTVRNVLEKKLYWGEIEPKLLARQQEDEDNDYLMSRDLDYYSPVPIQQ